MHQPRKRGIWIQWLVFKHTKHLCRLRTFCYPSTLRSPQMDETRDTGRVSLGLSVIVRVTLKDGVYHEVSPLVCV
jgi:hypothetical protein